MTEQINSKRITLRAPHVHGALTAAIAWSLRNVLLANLFCLLLFLVIGRNESSSISIPTALALGAASSLALWLAIIPRKYKARKKCNIVFLRGFHQEARADVPNRVLPCIGCYGQLLHLKNVVMTVESDRIGMLSGQTLIDEPIRLEPNADWRAYVSSILSRADLVVIDFSVLSENLFWEIEQAISEVTAKRIVLVSELSRFTSKNYLEIIRRFPKLSYAPSPVPVYPSRFVVPLRIWKWWFFQYERRMHDCMKQITSQS